jgi:hypothetical protein
MSLCGVVMIHDESQTIERAIASFGKVCDPIIGLDVGSTDGAADMARSMGALVYREEWTTHGAAATTLLAEAREHATHALLFGATETVEQVAPLPDLNGTPKYLLPTHQNGIVFRTERIFDTAIDWTCPGPVHSSIRPDFFEERRDLDALEITTHDDDGRRPGKLARYRDELETWLEDNPHDHRSVYYLAQTYYFLGARSAAAGLYKRRAAMSNGDVEAWHALYMAGVCEMAFDFPSGAALLLQAQRMMPHRAEPLETLEQACHMLRETLTVPTEGELSFVNPAAYLG